MAFYAKDGAIPVLMDFERMGKKISGMRAYGGYVYLDLQPRGEPVYRAQLGGEIEGVGTHEVSLWVKGQEIVGERVYLLEGGRLKIAQVVPQVGWVWP